MDPRGPLISIDKDKLEFDETEARRRGWSTLHRWSYQPTLEWLQLTLNRPMMFGKPLGEWAEGSQDGETAALKPVLGTHPSEYGGHGPGEALTEDSEVFKTFASFCYPVYAIGYNFLQSNEQSARDALDGIDFTDPISKKVTRIMGIREICRENHTDKAIVITHSMGGLVARMACVLCNGTNDILGVVHGVQPATGAPVFAKRFRTGGEGNTFQDRLINQSLLGRDADEFVAIASNAEGPMELSPMPDYNNEKPWWIVVDKKGEVRLSLPEKSALEELYVNDAWYGLLPDSGLLDPAGVVKKYLEEERRPISVNQHYKETMEIVVSRQKALRNAYHANTYATFGSGAIKPLAAEENGEVVKQEITEPEGDLLTFGKIVWQGDIPEGVTVEELKAAQLLHDSHDGTLKLQVRGQVVTLRVQNETSELSRPKEMGKDNGVIPGDGTVPAWSAEAQGRGLIPGVPGNPAQGMQMVFRQSGYNHQFSYVHPWSRWATLYSVARAVHFAKGGEKQ